jgi:hypothetical protein
MNTWKNNSYKWIEEDVEPILFIVQTFLPHGQTMGVGQTMAATPHSRRRQFYDAPSKEKLIAKKKEICFFFCYLLLKGL